MGLGDGIGMETPICHNYCILYFLIAFYKINKTNVGGEKGPLLSNIYIYY